MCCTDRLAGMFLISGFIISLLKENLIKKMTLTLSSAAVSFTASKYPSNTEERDRLFM
jgi:Gpi18-like mannosyltransferase